MTAEVCVMNRIAVALASDSAVTLSPNGKIYTSANKLFALSEHAPIGVMIYGNASFTQIPWETIIKIYRQELGATRFATLSGYASSLLSFLKQRIDIVTGEMQHQCAEVLIVEYLTLLRDIVREKLDDLMAKQGSTSSDEVERIVTQVIDFEVERIAAMENVDNLPASFDEVVESEYGELISNLIADILGQLPGVPANATLYHLVVQTMFKKRNTVISSGLVVAGFGESEIFPELVEYQIDGMIAGQLLSFERRHAVVDTQSRAWIIPFAQQEMVHTFMEGVDPFLLELFEQATLDVLIGMSRVLLEELQPLGWRTDEDLLNKVYSAVDTLHAELKDRLLQKRRTDYNAPVMTVVASLPKDELAAMAESLVNLTKFKRRVSQQMETVAGPIDVAVISKGDGFIWIKRKHYFSADLNPRFIARYTKGQLEQQHDH